MSSLGWLKERLAKSDVDNKLFENLEPEEAGKKFKRFVGNRLGEEIDRQFKTREEFRKKCKEVARYPEDYDVIRKDSLSSIIHGNSGFSLEKAKIFAQVLNVDKEYLLGIQDVRNISAEKQRERSSTIDYLANSTLDAIEEEYSVFTNSIFEFLGILEIYFNNYGFVCTTVNTKTPVQYIAKFIKHNTLLDVRTDNNTENLPVVQQCKVDAWKSILNWVKYSTFELSDGVNLKIDSLLLDSADGRITYSLGEFMSMVKDFKHTLSNRFDYWLNYAHYSIDNDCLAFKYENRIYEIEEARSKAKESLKEDSTDGGNKKKR